MECVFNLCCANLLSSQIFNNEYSSSSLYRMTTLEVVLLPHPSIKKMLLFFFLVHIDWCIFHDISTFWWVFAFILQLARRGFNIVLISRTQQKLDDISKAICEYLLFFPPLVHILHSNVVSAFDTGRIVISDDNSRLTRQTKTSVKDVQSHTVYPATAVGCHGV